MKLKLLLLALLLPFSAFGANTNAFDSVLIKNNLQITAGTPGAGKFWMSDAIGNGSWSLNASAFTNLNASSLASGTVPYARLPTGTATNITGGSGITVTPASGTYTIALTSGGGTGDVFRSLSNVYNAGTTQFMSHAVVSNTLTALGLSTFSGGVNIANSNLFLNAGATNLIITPSGGLARISGDNSSALTSVRFSLAVSGGSAIVENLASGNAGIILRTGTGLGSTIIFQAQGNLEVATMQTNAITIGTNNVSRVIIGPNTTSRGRGIVVGGNTITNSLLQGVSGTYGGSPTNITWPITFATVPFVVGSTTTSGGTVLLNDTFWVTNKTTTGATVGYRTAAGVDSAATITFDVQALGLQ